MTYYSYISVSQIETTANVTYYPYISMSQIETTANVTYCSYISVSQIITTAKPAQTEAQKKKVAWWVILLSVLGGVLLVGGVVAGLYKVRKLSFLKYFQVILLTIKMILLVT